MEDNDALKQQDMEALRLFVKHNNATCEGRGITGHSAALFPVSEEVFRENEQIKQMRDLMGQLKAGVAINQSQKSENYNLASERKRRTGKGLYEQMKASSVHGYVPGKVQMFGTGGDDSGYVAGVDPFEVEDTEPETLEELIPQLNFNLVEDIALIEKR